MNRTLDALVERSRHLLRLRRAAGVALLALVGLLAAPWAPAEAVPKRVLIIHSFGRDIAPFDAVAAAFRHELAQREPGPVVFFDTGLETGRKISPEEEAIFAAYLKARFGEPQPDLVATVGGAAAVFAVQQRDAIFPGVPVVLMGLDTRLAPGQRLRQGDALVATSLDPKQAFENILQVRPATTKVVMVLGNSPLEHFWRKVFEQASQPLSDRVQFEFFDGLSMAEMKRRIEQLPPDSAVLYGLLVVDGAGIPHERLEALSELRQVALVPVFSVFGNELGRGVVGGPYLSEARVGTEAARLALDILSGKGPEEPVRVAIGMEPPVYDARELARWQIAESLLPPGSQVRFRQEPVWRQYRNEIVAISVVMAALVLLVVALLVQRRQRRQAEDEARTLGGRLMTAYEDEGRRIARELHDDVTQRLASLSIEVASLPHQSTTNGRTAAEASIGSALSRLGRDVHALAYRLHPSVIDDLGLEAALRVECDRLTRRSGLAAELEADDVGDVPGDAALCLLRIAQETLRNVERHAGANRVRVELRRHADRVALGVHDDGCGFDPAADRGRASLGLASMRERVALLGGRLEVRSHPGDGTQVLATLPAGGAS
jgi:signal transduction histidine kinase